MNKLKTSIYSSLKDYQETYEFYRANKKNYDSLKLQLIETISDIDVINQAKVA